MQPLRLAQEAVGFYGWGGTSRGQNVSVMRLWGRPSWLHVLLFLVTNEVVNLVPFEMGCGEGSHSRREAGSEQRCEEAGSPGQGAGPDSEEAAGMTPSPGSAEPRPDGSFPS